MTEYEKTLILEYGQLGLKGIDDKWKDSTLTEEGAARMAAIREELRLSHQQLVMQAFALIQGS